MVSTSNSDIVPKVVISPLAFNVLVFKVGKFPTEALTSLELIVDIFAVRPSIVSIVISVADILLTFIRLKLIVEILPVLTFNIGKFPTKALTSLEFVVDTLISVVVKDSTGKSVVKVIA